VIDEVVRCRDAAEILVEELRRAIDRAERAEGREASLLAGAGTRRKLPSIEERVHHGRSMGAEKVFVLLALGAVLVMTFTPYDGCRGCTESAPVPVDEP
jgi:hypothetical protein